MLNRLHVCFNLFVLFFLVTPFHAVAVQPSMEWILIKKKLYAHFSLFQENGIWNETFLKFEAALSPYKWTESFFCGKNLEKKTIFLFEEKNCSPFTDGVQLSQGECHFEQAVSFLPLKGNRQKFTSFNGHKAFINGHKALFYWSLQKT